MKGAETFWRIERHEVTPSTNLLAAQRIAELQSRPKPESAAGLVIVARRQIAGRGQHGRTWESPPGGLYLSAIVDDVLPSARDKLPLVAGVAAVHALQKIGGKSLALRWPNDLVLDGKKVGGILCESTAQGRRWSGIIGIGINVNTNLSELPAILLPFASSLQMHLSRRLSLRAVERHLLNELAAALHRLNTEGFPAILQAARQFDGLRGKIVEVEEDGVFHQGLCAGLSDAGHLLLESNPGGREFTAATVSSVDGRPVRPR